jgi:hypothetical protein
MNATELAPKNSQQRHDRIRLVSRMAKYVCFVFLAFSIGFCILYPPWTVPAGYFPQVSFGRSVMLILYQIVLWLWYWKLTRLFHFYEQGKIFEAETIRCIKVLGLLFLVGWWITTLLHFFPMAMPGMPPPTPTAPGAAWTTVKTNSHFYRMGFFSFDFGSGINYGQLFLGLMIVLIAWIMDEGRKLQEEQELTV